MTVVLVWHGTDTVMISYSNPIISTVIWGMILVSVPQATQHNFGTYLTVSVYTKQ